MRRPSSSRQNSPSVARSGGGGGGAILVAANGIIEIAAAAEINADGGSAGSYSIFSCSRLGGPGSGGAIRLVAPTITKPSNGELSAIGGAGEHPGVIRIETINDGAHGFNVNPVALRTSLIAPLVNPVASWVAISSVDGEPVPESLSGPTGGMDLLLAAPGPIQFQIESAGVPAGTTIDLGIKPKVGGAALHETGAIDPGNCDAAGQCTTFITVDLPSGAYFAEAEATFQTP